MTERRAAACEEGLQMGKKVLALLLLGAVTIALSVGYHCRKQESPGVSYEEVWEEKS